MLNLFDLSGKTVLVTGASSGLGRDCSMLLAELGARVVLVARNQERMEQAQSQMYGEGHIVRSYDLQDLVGIPRLIEEVVLDTGPLHGIVHCAGLTSVLPLKVLSVEHIQKMMSINVNAAIMLAKGFRQNGHHTFPASIVLITSVVGLVGAKAQAAYCASKGALVTLAKALALELAQDEIRVNCVAPAMVRTEMYEQSFSKLSPDQIKALVDMAPLGLGEPRDVSHAIAFLLAPTGRWITGTTLTVDGGYTAR